MRLPGCAARPPLLQAGPHVRSRRVHGNAQVRVGEGVCQHRHLCQRRLDVVERLLHGRPPSDPLRPLRTALEAVCERLENAGRRRDKTPVEVHEAQRWYTHKTSGFKTSGFKTSGFKTSETSGLQNVMFTKCQVYKMSGLQNVRSSKRLVEKKHP
jgi:hypothetical protein